MIYALGIRHVGYETAQLLADHFGSVDALMAADEDEIAAIAGIGRTIAASVCAHFAEPHNRRVVEKLRDADVQLTGERRAGRDGPLAGRSYVLTGTLAHFTRNQAETRLKQLGASVSGSVSKKTAGVIAGDNPGSKLAAAERHGVPVLDETAFEALLREHE